MRWTSSGTPTTFPSSSSTVASAADRYRRSGEGAAPDYTPSPRSMGSLLTKEIADVTWLEDAGRAGWAVLMKDERIRYRSIEKHALLRHHV